MDPPSPERVRLRWRSSLRTRGGAEAAENEEEDDEGGVYLIRGQQQQARGGGGRRDKIKKKKNFAKANGSTVEPRQSAQVPHFFFGVCVRI